jgi:hypothetical protein
MEATLKFNLDDPEDVMAHKRCVKALEMALLLWQIKIKLDLPEKEAEQLDALFYEYNINLDELMM